MKNIVIILLFILSVRCDAQLSFYDMISETVNISYRESIARIRGEDIVYTGYRECIAPKREEDIEIDDSFFPFGYNIAHKPRNKMSNKKYKPRTFYIGGYNAYLRKDSIILSVSKTRYSFQGRRSRLYRRIDKFLPYSLYSNILLYVYTEDKGWKRKKHPRRLLLQTLDDNWLKGGVDLQDCIDFALNASIESFIICPVDISKILVLDNTFGSDFFANKYSFKRAFPYPVASEQNLKRRELRKFDYIFGWCEIFLNGNHIVIALRNVDGRLYVKKDIESATYCKYIYDFAYSDTQKKWICTKGLTIDYYHNTMTWNDYTRPTSL